MIYPKQSVSSGENIKEIHYGNKDIRKVYRKINGTMRCVFSADLIYVGHYDTPFVPSESSASPWKQWDSFVARKSFPPYNVAAIGGAKKYLHLLIPAQYYDNMTLYVNGVASTPTITDSNFLLIDEGEDTERYVDYYCLCFPGIVGGDVSIEGKVNYGHSGAKEGTNVCMPIVPTLDTDEFPTHYSIFGRGGYKSVASIVERDAIPLSRLEDGTMVYVRETNKEYRWSDADSTFVEVGGGGSVTVNSVNFDVQVRNKRLYILHVAPAVFNDYELVIFRRIQTRTKFNDDTILRKKGWIAAYYGKVSVDTYGKISYSPRHTNIGDFPLIPYSDDPSDWVYYDNANKSICWGKRRIKTIYKGANRSVNLHFGIAFCRKTTSGFGYKSTMAVTPIVEFDVRYAFDTVSLLYKFAFVK